MSEFLKFIDGLGSAVHLEIYYSSVMDWCIRVYKKGCASEYPESKKDGNDAILCDVQDIDMELAFAKAQVECKEWLIKFNNGY